jgi:hypothetical protein
MKKLMVLRVPKDCDPKKVRKQAKLVKKLHDKLWGKGSCEVIILEDGSDLYVAADTWEDSLAARTVTTPPVV